MEDKEMLTIEENPEIQNPTIKMGWLRSLLFFIAVLVLMSVGNLVGLFLSALITEVNFTELLKDPANIINEMGVGVALLVTFSGFLGTLLTVWLFRRFIDRQSFESLGFSFSNYKQDLLQGLFWGMGMISAGFSFLYLTDILNITAINFDIISLFGYLVLFTVVSFNEEIMIRGYFLNNLSQSFNKYIALLISALLFSLMHMSNANFSLIPFVNIILAGILLGIYYIHKQNLWFPIGMHLTWNYFQGPVLGFEVSGTKTQTLIVQNIQGNELLTGGEFGFEGSLIATLFMAVAITVIHIQFKNKS